MKEMKQEMTSQIKTKEIQTNGINNTNVRPKKCQSCCKFVNIALNLSLNEVDCFEKFKCPQCSKFFAALYLKVHIRKHEKKKRDSHECTLCGKKFGWVSHLRAHISSVHESKRFECPLCDKAFGNASSVKAHI